MGNGLHRAAAQVEVKRVKSHLKSRKIRGAPTPRGSGICPFLDPRVEHGGRAYVRAYVSGAKVERKFQPPPQDSRYKNSNSGGVVCMFDFGSSSKARGVESLPQPVVKEL
ncbi:hypothetical protein CRG98_050427 [Punica granatum]|uniref:Uncharacterized protein n=1 Tax=Punica granatum TaxID=22663 RepID=A0A2I0GBK5_PUNGR|nr:hypothetical protein CRG98_050427 [Punica granatum]